MLQLDLGRSADELAGEVTARCSALGPVTRVTVYPARSGPPARPFAIVSMGSRTAAESVASSVGGRTVGHSVIVFLEAAGAAAFPRPSAVVRTLPTAVGRADK